MRAIDATVGDSVTLIVAGTTEVVRLSRERTYGITAYGEREKTYGIVCRANGGKGAQISGLDARGAGARCGLLVGEIILSVDGATTTTAVAAAAAAATALTTATDAVTTTTATTGMLVRDAHHLGDLIAMNSAAENSSSKTLRPEVDVVVLRATRSVNVALGAGRRIGISIAHIDKTIGR